MKNNHFLNLSEGLDLLLHNSKHNKIELLNELFCTSKGRLNRKSYICRYLFLFLMFAAINSILELIGKVVYGAYIWETPIVFISFAFSIISFFCYLTMTVRRLHDLGHSGYLLQSFFTFNIFCFIIMVIFHFHYVGLLDYLFFMLLFAFNLIVNIIFGLYLLCRHGDIGPNEYGPDPLQ